MKHSLLYLLVLSMVLVGCSDDKVTDEGENQTDASEILQKSVDQSEEVSNVMVDFTLNQELELPELKDSLTVEQEDTTYIQTNPFQFLTELDTNYGNFTIFLRDDQLYVVDENDSVNPIVKEPLTNLTDLMKNQRHLPTILNRMQELQDDMTVEEQENGYVLNLTSEGEDYQSYVFEQLTTSALGAEELPIEEGNIDVQEVSIEVEINGDYQVQALNTSFVMSRQDDSDTTVTQTIERTYYDYDESTKEIPEA
ncbi:DUF6612 family protein [Aquisalibacillus elongatus]|uniref:Outer membrane lipoprotein-sorting protein n=1 Tax=Aquisalibacillus elongatus TaxID=485577 RepID=A0A3N5AYE1_9BACI|nr:DUF6612 family protein [Aquisalibacillus elongatus]RPF50276.1 hypothetical protein EDC24_2711 [Aquisalibacillus elongatus]